MHLRHAATSPLDGAATDTKPPSVVWDTAAGEQNYPPASVTTISATSTNTCPPATSRPIKHTSDSRRGRVLAECNPPTATVIPRFVPITNPTVLAINTESTSVVRALVLGPGLGQSLISASTILVPVTSTMVTVTNTGGTSVLIQDLALG